VATKKECFIKFVEDLMKVADQNGYDYMIMEQYNDAWDYWNALRATGDESKPAFTENGKKILVFMQENKDTFNNLFKAKEVGEQLEISSRTVSGGMRKLVTDGYVEKIGTSPVIYAITTKGENATFEANSEAE